MKHLFLVFAVLGLSACKTTEHYAMQLEAFRQQQEAATLAVAAQAAADVKIIQAKANAISKIVQSCPPNDVVCASVASSNGMMAIAGMQSSELSNKSLPPAPPVPAPPQDVTAEVVKVVGNTIERVAPYAAQVYINDENQITAREVSRHNTDLFAGVVDSATRASTEAARAASDAATRSADAAARVAIQRAPTYAVQGDMNNNSTVDRSSTSGPRTQGNNNDLSRTGRNRTNGETVNVDTEGHIGDDIDNVECVASVQPAGVNITAAGTTNPTAANNTTTTSTNNCSPSN